MFTSLLKAPKKAASEIPARAPKPPQHRSRLVSQQAQGHAVQPKLKVGEVDDPLEHEADHVAEAVLASAPVPAPSPALDLLQRKCVACESKEEKTLQRKSASDNAAVSVQTASVAEAASAVSGGGRPLSPCERAYFEPRFGRDLSGVRVHTSDKAASAADRINARAYTLGRDIAFARGAYRPDTSAGRRLIAHELAHTLQQEPGGMPVVRRAAYGSGAAPIWNTITLGVVPQDERAHLDEAIAKIDEVVADPVTYRECHQHYAERCPGGNDGTLAALWNRIAIWRITSPDPGTYARAQTGGSDIGYTGLAYNQGTLGLAATLMHEAGHCCGIPGGARHWHADLVSNSCMGPDSANAFAVSGRPGISGSDPALLFSYRRFLGDWAGGRLRATLGVDLDYTGVLGEIYERHLPEATRPAREFGSVTGGVQARLGGWGGTRYGGVSFRIETGFGVGRFALRATAPSEAPPTAVAPSWVLQVGPRAEFLIPAGSRALPVSVGAALRLAVPLNTEASALQGGLLSIEFRP